MWNKIEHRLFPFITVNWRGKPLVTHQAIVQLIAATTTRTGLEVRRQLDPNAYPGRDDQGRRLSDRLRRVVTEQALSALVPAQDDAIQILGQNGILGGLDDCRIVLRSSVAHQRPRGPCARIGLRTVARRTWQ